MYNRSMILLYTVQQNHTFVVMFFSLCPLYNKSLILLHNVKQNHTFVEPFILFFRCLTDRNNLGIKTNFIVLCSYCVITSIKLIEYTLDV